MKRTPWEKDLHAQNALKRRRHTILGRAALLRVAVQSFQLRQLRRYPRNRAPKGSFEHPRELKILHCHFSPQRGR
jgi:hypothetical protein